ncbi:hypothetical protein WJX73_008702 [Symbiochloris irregularis]|uniref:Uncharacterized protein n=1 Tax=Symbiochloris irregularis TaxID=706552 RepID=A0AAW1NHL6_9CHLO
MRKGFFSNRPTRQSETATPDHQPQDELRSHRIRVESDPAQQSSDADGALAGVFYNGAASEADRVEIRKLLKAPEALERCLTALKGPSDEARLSGLVVAAGLVKSLRGNQLEELRQIEAAVGQDFLRRLLVSMQPSLKKVRYPVGPADSVELGLVLLAAFLEIPGYAETELVITSAPLFARVISVGSIRGALKHLNTAQSADTPDQSLGACLDLAHALASSSDPIARQAAMRHGVLSAAAKCLAGHVPKHKDLAMQTLLLLSACLDHPSRADCFPVTMPQGKKLEAKLNKDAAGHAVWLQHLRSGVHQLLRAPLPPNLRHGALQLAAAATQLAGPAWLLGGSQEHEKGSFFQGDADAAEAIGPVVGLRGESLRDAMENENGQPHTRVQEVTPGPSQMLAGERAQQVLAAILSLLEAAVDALIQSTEAAEAAANGEPISSATLHSFTDKVASGLMVTLHDATKLLVEYLEVKAEQEGGLEEPLSLAVARSLGRFLRSPEVLTILLQRLTNAADAPELRYLTSRRQLPKYDDKSFVRQQAAILGPGTILVELLDDSVWKMRAGQDKQCSPIVFVNRTTLSDCVDALAKWSRVSRTLIVDVQAMQKELEALLRKMNPVERASDEMPYNSTVVVVGLMAAQVMSGLADCGFPILNVNHFADLIIRGLEKGQAVTRAHHTNLMNKHMRAGLFGSDEEGWSRYRLDCEQVTEHWERLLQCAIVLPELVPDFALHAAAHEWVKAHGGKPEVSVSHERELEVRLFCQAVHKVAEKMVAEHQGGRLGASEARDFKIMQRMLRSHET